MADTVPAYLDPTQTTEDAILQRMLGSVPSDLDTSEGSYIYDSLSPVASELAQAAIGAQQVLQNGFITTAASTIPGTVTPYLDMGGDEEGVPRRQAQAASFIETITGVSGTSIPSGSVFCTPADPIAGTSSVNFASQADVVIGAGGTVTVTITAVTPGASGNVAIGAISVLGQPISGVTSVSNTSQTATGADIEDDISYLPRLLDKEQNPGTSGNKADYKEWATSITGVGDAMPIPLWNGNGTVKVALIDTNKLPAAAATVTAVQTYIDPNGGTGDGAAPIGATVTVVAATGIDINVSATVVLDGTVALADAQTAFQSALAAYLAGIAYTTKPNTSPNAQYTAIGALLLATAGISDYSNLLINGGTANITINAKTAGEVAVAGTVTLSQ